MQGPHINEIPISDATPYLATCIVLAGCTILVDILIGGKIAAITKMFLKPLMHLNGTLIRKLNRQERSVAALRLRGTIILLFFLPLFAGAGYFLDLALKRNIFFAPLAILILLPGLGQKETWLEVSSLWDSERKSDPYDTTQAAAINLIHQYGTRFVPYVCIFLIGGFAVLTPYLFLCIFLGWVKQSDEITGPFFDPLLVVHQLLSLPGILVGGITLILARFFMTGTHLNPLKGLGAKVIAIPHSLYWPLAITAYGLELSFKPSSQVRKSRRQEADKSLLWVGPKSGAAKLTAAHLKKIWYHTLIATGLIYLAGLMIYTTVTLGP